MTVPRNNHYTHVYVLRDIRMLLINDFQQSSLYAQRALSDVCIAVNTCGLSHSLPTETAGKSCLKKKKKKKKHAEAHTPQHS